MKKRILLKSGNSLTIRSTCFSSNYPEISYKENLSSHVSVAPGENKTPSNILHEKDWDLKSFPCLHPDSRHSLHSERQVKLTDQEYFTQRIMNKDLRFANNPAYTFAGVAYIELKQIESKRGIAFQRGKKSITPEGNVSYSLEDPYSVLENIKNTPKYWEKVRYELVSKLENLGPFTFFFTLSCADFRWPENFTALLQDQLITYTVIDYAEEILVGPKGNQVPLFEYLAKNISKLDFIKQNLLNATLTFYQRVKMFMKHIVMSKGSPMHIKHYSYKVEFALRGAGHIHGVLWLDWKNFPDMENYGKIILEEAFKKIRNEETLGADDKLCLAEFADRFITCSLKDSNTKKIVEEVQIHHHTKTCRKYGSKCRFNFPRYPTIRTIVSVPYKNLQGMQMNR